MRQGMGGRQWGTEWVDFKHFHCCRDLLKLFLKRSNQDLKDYLIVDGKIFFARKWISDNEAEDPSLRQLSFDIWNLIKFSVCTLLLPKHLSCPHICENGELRVGMNFEEKIFPWCYYEGGGGFILHEFFSRLIVLFIFCFLCEIIFNSI